MPFGHGLRRHAQIERVIARARVFPPGDYRRWQVISELATASFKASFDSASALIRAADPASKTLGAEIFDQLFVGLRDGRRFARQAEELLRALCEPTQHPEVLCAALHPYAQLSPDPRPLLYELLEHPDGRVRSTAAQLIAVGGGEFADDRQVDSLIALLDRDPDPAVREQAAEGLELVLTCYPYVSQQPRITDASSAESPGRSDTGHPGVRDRGRRRPGPRHGGEAASSANWPRNSPPGSSWTRSTAFPRSRTPAPTFAPRPIGYCAGSSSGTGCRTPTPRASPCRRSVPRCSRRRSRRPRRTAGACSWVVIRSIDPAAIGRSVLQRCTLVADAGVHGAGRFSRPR